MLLNLLILVLLVVVACCAAFSSGANDELQAKDPKDPDSFHPRCFTL